MALFVLIEKFTFQNWIDSVRECARSQGFHDSFKFFDTILEKHNSTNWKCSSATRWKSPWTRTQEISGKKDPDSDEIEPEGSEEQMLDNTFADSNPLPIEEENDVVDLDGEQCDQKKIAKCL